MEMTWIPTTPQKRQRVVQIPISPPITPGTIHDPIQVGSDDENLQQATGKNEALLGGLNIVIGNPTEDGTVFDACTQPDQSPRHLEEESDDSESDTKTSSSDLVSQLLTFTEDDAAEPDLELWKPILYVNLPHLPSGKPLNFPHVIDDSFAFNEEDAPNTIRIPDAIATLLYKCNPGALDLFLDLSIDRVEFIRTEQSQYHFDLVISRRGRDVRVGFFSIIPTTMNGHEYDMYEWDALVKSKITNSGVWLTQSATRCGLSDGVWDEDENQRLAFHSTQLHRIDQMHEISRQLATAIVVRKLWEKDEGSAFSMTVKT